MRRVWGKQKEGWPVVELQWALKPTCKKAGEFGISRCKLSYIGWINNKVLLDSTGNYPISWDKP